MLRRLAITLWTLFAVLGLHAAPAFALASTAESAAARPGRDADTVTTARSGSVVEARRVERRPQTTHHGPAALLGGAARPALPTAIATTARASTWMPWETASSARARLMIFLN